MDWLSSLDASVFRFFNLTLSNPFLDWLLPFFSWNSFFVPVAILAAVGLIWKGGARGRIFLMMLLVVTVVGDGIICNFLKDAIARERPFQLIPEAHLLVGRGRSGSMPSSHAANWFAASAIAYFFYRRSLWFMLPLAVTVAFSRVYLGVHYCSDVLVGSLLGITYAVGILWSLNLLWMVAGERWFPLWWAKLPSLLKPAEPQNLPLLSAVPLATSHEQPVVASDQSAIHQHWLRLGYVLIFFLFVVRLTYLAGHTIQLSEDEAYQWLWSKHLALSYYSKPPLIAYTQYLGTSLWGDTELGIRFFSPVIAAIISLILLRFLASEVNAPAGFALLLITAATPLMAVGTILMTIDPLSVLFWTAAMVCGWRAVQQDSTRSWLWTGLWMGLGFLSKYTALFQLLCWAVFFLLWQPARKQLRRPGPYLGLLITALCTLPVLIWNAQNGWITVVHLANRGGLDRTWHLTFRYLLDFIAAEVFLLNPIFFLGMIWAGVALILKIRRRSFSGRDSLMIYLLSMGAPLFLFYLLYTFRARVQPNWIAPSVVPLFCLMVVYWEAHWREGARNLRRWLIWGVGLGIAVVVLLHDTDLIQKIATKPLPPDKDPLRRVRGWSQMAQIVGAARTELLREGQSVFVIADHYGLTGLLSFYMPEAKTNVCHDPVVYYQSSKHAVNQFYFWPGYHTRKGQNAIFVQEVKAPETPPKHLQEEFQSVIDLGMRDVVYRGRTLHRIQLFQCRNLR